MLKIFQKSEKCMRNLTLVVLTKLGNLRDNDGNSIVNYIISVVSFFTTIFASLWRFFVLIFMSVLCSHSHDIEN